MIKRTVLLFMFMLMLLPAEKAFPSTFEACGYHTLPIDMEQVPNDGSWDYARNGVAMSYYNQYMNIYTTHDSNGGAGHNGDNEFGGFRTDADLYDTWGIHWKERDLAVTKFYFWCECCEYSESDIMFNAGYKWTASRETAEDDPTFVLYDTVLYHEMGHSWGLKTRNEDYSYNVPTVMHYYHHDVINDTMTIHAMDAQLLRKQYMDQTGKLGITNLGVFSKHPALEQSTQLLTWANSTTDKGDYKIGDDIRVNNLLVENMSDHALSDVHVRFYLSTDRYIDTADTLIGDFFWGSFPSEVWNVGSYVMSIPEGLADGTYYVGAIVTYNGSTADNFWDDNSVRLWNTITVRGPDLIIQDVSIAPANPAKNQDVTVTVTVKNQGTNGTHGFYISLYQDLPNSPVVGNYGDQWCQRVLDAGATTTCTKTIKYLNPGSYNLYAQVDSGDDVGESNEGNNVYGPRLISVGMPDLVATGITVGPPSAVAGQTVDVTVYVENRGASDMIPTGMVIQYPRVTFYKDRATAPMLNDEGDFGCYLGRLAAGASTTCTGTVKYATGGSYNTWAQVDSTNRIAESNESNNIVGPHTFRVDGPAEIRITGPANPTNSTSATLTFSSSRSGSTYQCGTGDGFMSSCTSPVTYTGLSEGPHTLFVTATDGYLNVTTAWYYWVIDLTGPVVTITAKPDDPTWDTTTAISFESSEPNTRFLCSLDGAQPWSECNSPMNYTGLRGGVGHSFEIVGTDAAGNQGPYNAYQWTINGTAIITKPDNPSNSTTAAFAFISTAPNPTVQCSIDGGAFSDCTNWNYANWEYEMTYNGLSEGNHTFVVQAFDTVTLYDDNGDPYDYTYAYASPDSYTWLIATTPLEKISAGTNHSCRLKADGSVACWGDNTSGKATPPAGTFKEVSAGDKHTCGVKTDGAIACWGDNTAGKATPPAGTFKEVSAGFSHTCGLKPDFTVTCWGDNYSGKATPPAGTFKEVTVGNSHSCGLTTEGTVICWGEDQYQGTPPDGPTFTKVSAGAYHTCGLVGDGTVTCWGYNENEQAAPPAGIFRDLSAGAYHTCGLKTDRTVACWGLNTSGQTTPPAGTFSAVSAGGYHTCGVRTDGTVTCWGLNTSGQAPAISINPAALPNGYYGAPYSQTLSASGGQAPYIFAITGRQLPDGFTLTPDGTLSGTPVTANSFTFTVQAADKNYISGVMTYTVAIDIMSYTLSPASLPFHSLLNVQSAAQKVTVSNTGTLPLPISSITIGGTNNLQFAQTNNCGAGLAVGASCTVNVTFKPTWSNALPMSATLNLNVPSPAGSKSVTLSGTIDVMSYTIAPASLAFHSLLNVQSATQTVTVSNTGNIPLPINSITIGGANNLQFSQTNNCGTSLAVGASCTVNLTFKPTWLNASQMSATLNINVAAPAVSKAVALTGTLDYTLSPATLPVFVTPLNVPSAVKNVTVTNTTGAVLTINSISLTGTNPGQFSLTNNCGSSLAVGASCVIGVTFRPTWANPVSNAAMLNVNVAAPAISKTISLAGTLDYTLSPATLPAFVTPLNVQSTVKNVTVTNTKGVVLAISSISLGGTNPGQFSQTNTCGSSLAVGASCVISVTFRPTWANPVPSSATLNVNVAAPALSKTIGLTGTMDYTLSPAALPAFVTPLNVPSAVKNVTVTNTTGVPLTISSISLGGTNPGQFSQTNNCGSSLAVGASCVIGVTFRPTWANPAPSAATLNVNVAAPAASKVIALTGTLDYTLSPSTLAVFHSPLNVTSAGRNVTVSNTTGNALAISSIAIGGTNPGQFSQTNNCGSGLPVGASCVVSVVFRPTWVNTVPMSATLNVNVASPAASKSMALTGTTP